MYDWKEKMKKVKILIPLFNDWKSVTKLLNEIDLQTNNWSVELSVVIVNDASTEQRSDIVSNFKNMITAIKSMDFERASKEMINSKWYKQTPKRVDLSIGVMLKNND